MEGGVGRYGGEWNKEFSGEKERTGEHRSQQHRVCPDAVLPKNRRGSWPHRLFMVRADHLDFGGSKGRGDGGRREEGGRFQIIWKVWNMKVLILKVRHSNHDVAPIVILASKTPSRVGEVARGERSWHAVKDYEAQEWIKKKTGRAGNEGGTFDLEQKGGPRTKNKRAVFVVQQKNLQRIRFGVGGNPPGPNVTGAQRQARRGVFLTHPGRPHLQQTG